MFGSFAPLLPSAIITRGSAYWKYTLSKTKMEPKNGGWEDEFPFQTGGVQVPCWFSRVFSCVFFVDVVLQGTQWRILSFLVYDSIFVCPILDKGDGDCYFDWFSAACLPTKS